MTGHPTLTRRVSGSTVEPRQDQELLQMIERVRAAVGQMRYGQVVVHVRAGVVTQIERSEKTRTFQLPERPVEPRGQTVVPRR